MTKDSLGQAVPSDAEIAEGLHATNQAMDAPEAELQRSPELCAAFAKRHFKVENPSEDQLETIFAAMRTFCGYNGRLPSSSVETDFDQVVKNIGNNARFLQGLYRGIDALGTAALVAHLKALRLRIEELQVEYDACEAKLMARNATETAPPKQAIGVATRQHLVDAIQPFDIDTPPDSPENIELRKRLCKERSYSFVGRFSANGIARAKSTEEGFWLIVNRSGEKIGDTSYKYMSDFHEGFAKVRLSSLDSGPRSYSFVNEAGKLAVETDFEAAEDFSCGLAPVVLSSTQLLPTETKKTKERCYYIDTNFQIACGGQMFLEAHPFKNGLAQVKLATGEWATINTDGKIMPPEPPQNSPQCS